MNKFLLIALLTGFSFSAGAQTRVAVEATKSASVKFYPNPATSVINFEISKAAEKGFTLQVYHFMGRKMFEQFNMPERLVINLTDYSRGVYIYQLRDRTGRIVESGKFQVSK